MKVIHISLSHENGGGFIAARRTHDALSRYSDITSELFVAKHVINQNNILGVSKVEAFQRRIKQQISKKITKLVWGTDETLLSPSIFGSSMLKRINNSDADVIHLHWVQDETLSISDIAKINKPTVWTLHDMWAFSGAEHYPTVERWKAGYTADNQPQQEHGWDLNRWVWNRKIKHWRKPIDLICPSNWLAQCVTQSALMKNFPVKVIPNCIDTHSWKKISQITARRLLNIPLDKKIILFGAIGGSKDPRKGFDLLEKAITHPSLKKSNIRYIIFGDSKTNKHENQTIAANYVGHLNEEQLRLYLNSSDAVIIPSRKDNLPLIALEAQSCGIPIIAFNIGGMPDIIEHKKSGYLATPYFPSSLADGIQWIEKLSSLQMEDIRKYCRKNAQESYHDSIVGEQLLAAYAEVINKFQKGNTN